MKISELIEILQRHIDLKGDDRVYVYDDYQGCYKTINKSHVSAMFPDGIAIECEEEE